MISVENTLGVHWNVNVVILMKCLSVAALEVVKMKLMFVMLSVKTYVTTRDSYKNWLDQRKMADID